MTNLSYKILSIISVFIGGISFVFFFVFTYDGAINLIDLRLGEMGIILTDISLSAAFFAQHSLMIRKRARNRIMDGIPNESFYAFYSITSGLTLVLVMLFWQKSSIVILSLTDLYLYFARFLYIASVIGLLWGVLSLKGFDPFGSKQISRYIKNKKTRKGQFALKGPYKIIRHPFYFFILLMIWSYPVLTIDRFVFGFLWTIWIIVGTIFEERDLIDQIGDEYREYQKRVPMIIPYKIGLLQKK